MKSYRKSRDIYLIAVSSIGLFLFLWSLLSLPKLPNVTTLLLLTILAISAQITSTMLVGGNIIVEVGTAISMATIALYGPFAASIVAVAGVTTTSIVDFRSKWPGWKSALERIGFNLGMATIAVFLTHFVFQSISSLLGNLAFLGLLATWLLAAVVYDQINLWVLIVLLHLQNKTHPLKIWLQHKWAIPINILVIGIGGGILTVAIQQFNFLGIAIFFLPIVLSAYSFRLYVNQAKKQMEQLEELVTERTKDLEEANVELADLSQEKDQFLAVLTHDMRTPLTSIKGYASILRDRDMSRDQQTHIAKVILKSQDTLLEIVNNILEIEKLQSGVPVVLEMNDFDLALLAQSVAESLGAPASEKNITLHYEEVPSPIIVKADEQKIQRVITNLISNAIKYTAEGGEVFVETAVHGRFATLSIRDTGYGIPADELPHIFDRYSRVKKHQTFAIGTGLGLAIVKSLIEAHDGQIEVTSVENEGSTFTVKLPVQ